MPANMSTAADLLRQGAGRGLSLHPSLYLGTKAGTKNTERHGALKGPDSCFQPMKAGGDLCLYGMGKVVLNPGSQSSEHENPGEGTC